MVPGRLHHRELPGPVPQLVLRDARDEHGPAARGAVQDDLRLRDAVRRGRPPHAQELGQRDRVRRGRRAHGRGRHALDVRVGAARRQHPVRLARRRRGTPRPARPVERLRVLRHLRPARGLERPRAGAPPVAERPPLDRWILSRSAGVAAQVEARLRDYDAEAATRVLARLHRRPLHVVPAAVAAPDVARRRRADRDAAFATLHEALVALARTVAPILPFLSESMYAQPGGRRRSRRARTAST